MEKLGRIVAERIDSGRGTGIAAGVVLADGRTAITTHGDAGQGSPVHDNTVFEIGSITKLFTATLLAEMAQRHEVASPSLGRSWPLPKGNRCKARDLRWSTLGRSLAN
jgi:D-alanyl-D-alanine-carboxypeptidase/D-alanyl-D-alanine-endopeptidase